MLTARLPVLMFQRLSTVWELPTLQQNEPTSIKPPFQELSDAFVWKWRTKEPCVGLNRDQIARITHHLMTKCIPCIECSHGVPDLSIPSLYSYRCHTAAGGKEHLCAQISSHNPRKQIVSKYPSCVWTCSQCSSKLFNTITNAVQSSNIASPKLQCTSKLFPLKLKLFFLHFHFLLVALVFAILTFQHCFNHLLVILLQD